MDAFYASVEIRDNPKLKEKPVIIGTSVITTCNYIARKYGLHSAMSVTRARILCPQGVYLRVNMAKYMEASRQIKALVLRLTNKVEFIASDEGFIDITDIIKKYPSLETFATRFQRGIYNNVNLSIQQVINNITKNLKNKNNIKQLQNFYFRYKKQYNNLDEKLKDNAQIREIFLNEFDELLDNIQEEEKEFILQQTKKNLVKTEELDYTNLVSLFFLQIPMLLLNKTTNTLIILNSNVISELKQNFIKKVAQDLKINLEEIDEQQYQQEQEQFLNSIIGKKVTEILKNNDITENLNIKKLLEENKRLKQENAELKKLSKQLIKHTEKLEQNIKNYEQFIEKDVITLIYTILNSKDKKLKEKMEKELQLKLTQNPIATFNLSM
jgi:hypothetical protein